LDAKVSLHSSRAGGLSTSTRSQAAVALRSTKLRRRAHSGAGRQRRAASCHVEEPLELLHLSRRVGEDQPDPLPSQIPSCRITAAGSSGTTRRAGPRSCDPRTQERIALKELLVGFPCEGVSSRPSI